MFGNWISNSFGAHNNFERGVFEHCLAIDIVDELHLLKATRKTGVLGVPGPKTTEIP